MARLTATSLVPKQILGTGTSALGPAINAQKIPEAAGPRGAKDSSYFRGRLAVYFSGRISACALRYIAAVAAGKCVMRLRSDGAAELRFPFEHQDCPNGAREISFFSGLRQGGLCRNPR